MSIEAEVAKIRATTRKHNGSFRRKIRRLYQENPEAAKIVEKEVSLGNQTEDEFPIKSIIKIPKHEETDPFTYLVWWGKTINRPEAFIGCEQALKDNLEEFKNKSIDEIRQKLINEYNFNSRMRKNEEFNDWIDKNQKRIFEANKRIRQKYTKVSDKEYEDIVIPKIRKN